MLAGPGPHQPAEAVATAVSALVFLARRLQPLIVSLVAFAAETVCVAITPQTSPVQFFGILATFAIVGAIQPQRDAIIGWVGGAAFLAYGAWGDPLGGGAPDYLLSLGFATTMWGAGVLVRRHRLQSAEAATRAALAERQGEEARRALQLERARIARELHDVVSHGLSVVVVQTLAARGALSDLGADTTGVVDRHLDAVESTAREALGEMRRMLGLLQLDEGDPVVDPAVTPSPGLRHLPALVDRSQRAGISITVARLDTDSTGSPGLDLAVYRIVQEALTNVVRHAPSARVDLCVAATASGVEVVVTDTGGGHPVAEVHGGGQGLVGMRERVALYGGRLEAGPTAGGGFRVRATLPVETATSRTEAVGGHRPTE